MRQNIYRPLSQVELGLFPGGYVVSRQAVLMSISRSQGTEQVAWALLIKD